MAPGGGLRSVSDFSSFIFGFVHKWTTPQRFSVRVHCVSEKNM